MTVVVQDLWCMQRRLILATIRIVMVARCTAHHCTCCCKWKMYPYLYNTTSFAVYDHVLCVIGATHATKALAFDMMLPMLRWQAITGVKHAIMILPLMFACTVHASNGQLTADMGDITDIHFST